MSLKATIKKAVKSAFLALDDIPSTAVYHYVTGTPTRDLETGTYTKPTTDYPLKRVVFTKFTQKEVDKYPGILLTDSKVLFLAEEMSVTPKDEDTLTDVDGVTWEIAKYMTDPTKTLVSLAVRK